MNLAYWLRKSPQPVTVLADDKRIPVTRNGRGWRELTNTIKAMDPSKVTCLDAQDQVIRSVVLETEDDKEGAPPSPEMSDLQLFARLLAEAYDKGASKMQPIVDSAMAFVERGGARLAKAEAESDRLRAHVHKLNLQIAELSAAPLAPERDDSIFGTIVAGAVQAGLKHDLKSQDPAPAPVTSIKGSKK